MEIRINGRLIEEYHVERDDANHATAYLYTDDGEVTFTVSIDLSRESPLAQYSVVEYSEPGLDGEYTKVVEIANDVTDGLDYSGLDQNSSVQTGEE